MITPAYSPTATERVLPRMALDFTTGVLDPRVTVTRASNTATCFNASGFIETVNANLPRFDYDPVTLAPKGLLIEEARTNLVLQSQTFQTTWTNQETTEQVNAGIAPDGLLTAEKLIPTIVNDSHWINQNITVSAGLNTFSFYAKADGYSVVQALNSPTTDRINFDLSNGTVGSATGFTGTITAVGNGWYRCTATTTTTATTSGWARIGIVPSSTSARGAAFAGDGTSGVLIWGAQMELGAFATSYIPTVASQATRNPDVATMTGTNFSSWYNASEGAFLAKFSFPAIPASQFRYVLSANDGTATNFIAIAGNTTSNVPAGRVIASSSTQASMGGGSIVANQQAIGVLAYKLDSFAYGQNGATIGTDATGLVPTVNRLDIGALTTSFACCHIQRVSYWPQRIINNEALAFSK
jgi:hypothetical protein